MRKFLLISFIMLMLVPSILAHSEEGIEPPGIVTFIWALHSWTHWLVWIFFIYSCYYFRQFIGYVSGHPGEDCRAEETEREYHKENWVKQMHGIFVWIMLIWTVIHFSEIIGAWLGYSESPVYSLGELIPGDEIWELVYVIATFALLSTCHYVRYFIGGNSKCSSCCKFGRQKAFSVQSFINNYHGWLFWVVIISIVFVLLSGGHL